MERNGSRRKDRREFLREVLAGFIITGILYLFYHTYFVFTLLLPCVAGYRKLRVKAIAGKEKALLNIQFKDMLDSLSASLRAGYSIENALWECERELTAMHGEDSPICIELNRMNHQIQVGITAEEVFRELAQRSGIEDIDTFASVFSIAKRTGGDMIGIIRRSAEDIGGKLDTRKEIDVLISAKRLEQRIMSFMPVLILVYIDLSCDGLLDPLYGNLTGALIMTGCLLLYAAAIWLGNKVMRIEV